MTEEGRKAWAVVIAWGCGVAMTAYATAALYLVRFKPMLVFWLGESSMFIILIVITAYTGLLIKRTIGAKFRDVDINVTDHDGVA